MADNNGVSYKALKLILMFLFACICIVSTSTYFIVTEVIQANSTLKKGETGQLDVVLNKARVVASSLNGQIVKKPAVKDDWKSSLIKESVNGG